MSQHDNAPDPRSVAMLRLTLAELLIRHIPRRVEAFRDGENDDEARLHQTDAHELARDLLDDLEARGYVVGRAST